MRIFLISRLVDVGALLLGCVRPTEMQSGPKLDLAPDIVTAAGPMCATLGPQHVAPFYANHMPHWLTPPVRAPTIYLHI